MKITRKKSNLPKLIGNLVIKEKEKFKDATIRRWSVGKSVNGGEITPGYRSPKYRQFKISLNPSAGGNVDLILTGALSRALNMKKESETSFLLYSTDKKFDKLSSKYGADEFGVTDDEWLEISEEILAFALDEILEFSYE